MATKIRLARHGHKDYAFYHIVVADSRSPRDGKIIERLGSFNPNTNPAAVILDFDRALYWVGVGAQPTDTVRTILSNEGVMLMKHLNGGVAKGAFSQEEAQKRFDAWKAQKDAKNGKISQAEADKKAAAAKALLAQEVETNKAIAAKIVPLLPQSSLLLHKRLRRKLLPQKQRLKVKFPLRRLRLKNRNIDITIYRNTEKSRSETRVSDFFIHRNRYTPA